MKYASSRAWPSLILVQSSHWRVASGRRRWTWHRRCEWRLRTNCDVIRSYVNHIADDNPRQRCWCRKSADNVLLRHVHVRQVASSIQRLTFDIGEIYPARRSNTILKKWNTAINLYAEAIIRPISDAIFPLPVMRSLSTKVHSLSLWRILLFVLTISYVKLTISLQNHSSPATSVLIDYKRRHIPLPVWRKMPPNAHSLRQRKSFMRSWHLNYCSQRHYALQRWINGVFL